MVRMAPANQSFLKHALVYGVGGVLLQAASVVLLPLYTRYLAPADYGVLEILNRTGEVVVVLLMANGIRGAAFTFYCRAESDQERVRVASTVTLLVWLGILCGLLFAVLCTGFLTRVLGTNDRGLTLLGVAACLAQLLPTMPMALMQARLASAAFIAASALAFVLRVGLIIVGVVWCGWGVAGVLGGTLVASVILGVALTFREFGKSGFRVDASLLPAVLRFAWPFLPGGLCGFMLQNGDRFFLLRFSGADVVGVYSLGYKLAFAVGLLSFLPLFKVWSAWLYQVYARDDAATSVGRAVTWLLAPSLFLGLGACLFAREALLILGTKSYLDAARIIPPVVLASWFINCQVLMDSTFYYFRCSGRKLGVTLASTVVILVLYLALIPRYEAMGAALATLGAFIFHAALTYCVAQRVFQVEYGLLRLGAMLLIAVSLMVVAHYVPGGALQPVWKGMLWLAWPVIVWTIGLVSCEEKRWLQTQVLSSAEAIAQRLLRRQSAENAKT